jgi:hypothetical protein
MLCARQEIQIAGILCGRAIMPARQRSGRRSAAVAECQQAAQRLMLSGLHVVEAAEIFSGNL